MMYKFLLLILSIFIATTLYAQGDFGLPATYPKEVVNICNSACVESVDIYFNFDAIDTLNVISGFLVLPITMAQTKYSINEQSSYSTLPMIVIGSPEYDNTYQANIEVPSAEDIYYYYQIETDSTFSSLSPKNIADLWPPPNRLLANIHDDPAGDDVPVMLESEYNWDNTDLRNLKLGYSDSRYYMKIVSQGGFTTSHDGLKQLECGIIDKYTTVYHLYGVPLINPNSPYPDSILYAVLYGDVDISFLGIGIQITPGVYKICWPTGVPGITDYLNAYEKISDASSFSYSISGNTLNMWCSLGLLTSDPDFGPLRDDSLLITGCGFASAWIAYKSCGSWVPDTFNYVVHDFSKKTGFYLQTGYCMVDSNHPPYFESHSDTSVGDTFLFSAVYHDDDNNQPTIRQMYLEVNGSTYVGSPFLLHSSDHSYDDGSEFQHSCVIVDPVYIIYSFEFSDGQDTITLADTILSDLMSFQVSSGIFIINDLPFGNTYTMDGRNPGEPFNIINNGTIPIDLGLQISYVDTPWSSGYAPDSNRFVLRGRFTDDSTSAGEFVPYNDYVRSDSVIWATDLILGLDGYDIPNILNPENWNSLWLQFIAPTYSDIYYPDTATIRLNIVAREHVP